MCNSNHFGNPFLLRIAQYDSVLFLREKHVPHLPPPPIPQKINLPPLTKPYGDDVMPVQQFDSSDDLSGRLYKSMAELITA